MFETECRGLLGNMLDHEKWEDLPAKREGNALTLDDVRLALAPTIIRLTAVP